MTWVKLDDNMPTHPKILAVGPAAAWLHICGISYCSRLLTDGFVPKAALPVLGGPAKEVRRLVDEGLWVERDGGWEIAGYLDWNPSREDVEQDRARKAEGKSAAGSFGNHQRWHVDRGESNPDCRFCIADSSQSAIPVRSQTIAPSHPIPSHPIPETPLAIVESETKDDEFEKFWTAYPRRTDGSKGAKKAAQKRWEKLSSADRLAVVAALPNYAQSDAPRRGFAMDASKWIGPDEHWREWVQAPQSWAAPVEGARGVSAEGDDMEFRFGAWYILRDGQRFRAQNGPVPA